MTPQCVIARRRSRGGVETTCPSGARDNRPDAPRPGSRLAGRGRWSPIAAGPGRPETIHAAERLLELVADCRARPPSRSSPGTISFEWEAADHGWLTLTVDGQGQLTHSAVLGEDEFSQAEAFDEELPDWAATLLQRLLAAGTER